MSEEFRRFTRRDTLLKVEVIDMMTQHLLGTVVNISEYGIMMIAHVPIHTDAIYQCEFLFPNQYRFRSPFIIGIQEMWTEPVASGGVNCVGFRIIDIEKPDRLRINEWVNEPHLS